MDSDTYQRLCLRTESAPPVEVFSERNPSEDLPDILEAIQKLSQEADRLKKLLFYGKAASPQYKITTLPGSEKEIRILHAVLGIQSELGEILEAMSQGDARIADEFGDVAWYVSVGEDAVGASMGSIMQANIEKLRVRFPGKFEAQAAIQKDEFAEAEAFNQVLRPST